MPYAWFINEPLLPLAHLLTILTELLGPEAARAEKFGDPPDEVHETYRRAPNGLFDLYAELLAPPMVT